MAAFSLRAPLTEYDEWGAFRVQREGAAGGATLELPVPMQPGTWRAWYLGPEKLDVLVQQRLATQDAPHQLVCVHAEAHPPSGVELPSGLERVGAVDIEGARFTLACASLAEELESDDGFYAHLDGVHGLIRRGCGVHVMLDGDGRAEVFSDRAGTVVVVQIS